MNDGHDEAILTLMLKKAKELGFLRSDAPIRGSHKELSDWVAGCESRGEGESHCKERKVEFRIVYLSWR